MINSLIAFSIRNKLIVSLGALAILLWGLLSLRSIPLDAVPDITNNQIQVITRAPSLAAQEVEQIVTFPIEMQLANLPDVVEMRSISRFGLSVISIVFEESVDPYLGRQMISEQLQIVQSSLPKGVEPPALAPLTSGLGEVFQYVLIREEGYEDKYTDMDLRTMHDWIVRRQLMGTPGVIEVSGWGGHLKQYEVQINTSKLNALGVSVADVFDALEANNNNAGGSYIEKRFKTYFIRTEGRVNSMDDIEKIAVKSVDGIPVLIRDIAKVDFGSAPRYGAITYNGKGEVVGGQALMLKGADSYQVVHAVKAKIDMIQKALPEGVKLQPYLDRSELIDRAITTVRTNLLEGGIIVILILVLLLGNFRGGLIVASVIPLSMAFALGMMNLFGVSANLMSLGAIDFGLIVDGSVIITEAIVFHIFTKYNGQTLSQPRMDEIVFESASKIRSSAAFGEIIILIVYLPLLALSGIEGKMFKPMAQTVSFAILGALILSVTYVPMMAALVLKKKVGEESKVSTRITDSLRRMYVPLFNIAVNAPKGVLGVAVVLFAISWVGFSKLGGEFVPTLEEGDLALHQILPPGSSLNQSVEVSAKIQDVLLKNFPEVEMVVNKIGSSEVPTDPMPIEVGDIIVKLKPKSEWVSASTKEELFERMEEKLVTIPGINYEFTQPIQMRFNELMSGVREDIAIMLYGENLEVLADRAKAIEAAIKGIQGVGDVRVEQTTGQQQMVIEYNREKMAQYAVTVDELNALIKAGFAGSKVGDVYENERKFDLVLRLEQSSRQSIEDINNLLVPIRGASNIQVPLSVLAKVEMKEGPMQISRQSAKRKIAIGVNARNRDIQSLVEEIRSTIDNQVVLPEGYAVHYGGKFQNMVEAQKRLAWAVPAALLLILSLLYITFNSIKSALLIFSAIPLAAIGGVWSLWFRDMPFSISAGIGFIALFGVAVLNGIVLIAKFEDLKDEGYGMDDILKKGTSERLRPVIMTAMVAALGFLPMALSSSAGAEVQRPLATVVIGGLITSTLLTLVVLPALYKLFNKGIGANAKHLAVVLPLLMVGGLQAQDSLTLEKTLSMARDYHPSIAAANYHIEEQQQMKKSGIDLGKTSVSWSYGQMNTSAMDHQVSVGQDFDFIFTSRRNVEYRKAMVEMAQLEGDLAEEELDFAVRNDYYQLAYLREMLKLQKQLARQYENIVRSARKMEQVGETGSIDRITAESRLARVKLMVTQLESEIELSRIHLEQWVGSFDTDLMPSDALQSMSQSNEAGDTLLIELQRQRVMAMESQWKVERNEFAPKLKLMYWQQQIDGEGGFNGVGAGVSLPIFFWAQDGRTKAARARYQVQEEEFKAYQAEYRQSLRSAQEEVWRSERMINFYEHEGLKSAEALEKASTQSYAVGDIGYLEYFAGIEEAWQLRADYLARKRDYQVAKSYYQFLRGDSTK